MKQFMVFILVLSAFFVRTPSLYAFGFSHGDIDETYGYHDLEFRESRTRGNSISGTIVNKTDQIHDNVMITIYGMDFFDKILWKEVVFMDDIDKNGKVPFCISLGREMEPSKLSFKVSENTAVIPFHCLEKHPDYRIKKTHRHHHDNDLLKNKKSDVPD